MKHSIYQTEGISLTTDISDDLFEFTKDTAIDKIFILLDENTEAKCWSLLKSFRDIPESQIMVIRSGEENKNLKQVEDVWNFLGEQMADRNSILINIGGGMLTDLGGFAAATFKRGIRFINIPTTLLAMVDASVGGKTGVNFRGLKNEVGVISQAQHVFLHLPFLRTINDQNYKSGFSEMLKAGLIADKELWSLLKDFDLEEKSEKVMTPILWRSVMIKKVIITEDPNETGNRKSLNFGHTIGHALESHSLHEKKSLLHGYAVAYGMVVEASLSLRFSSLTSSEVEEIKTTIESIYGDSTIEITDSEKLIEYMRFDKKNEHNQINFTLLEKIGSFNVNNFIAEDHISEALGK